jgi:hypothetical protein
VLFLARSPVVVDPVSSFSAAGNELVTRPPVAPVALAVTPRRALGAGDFAGGFRDPVGSDPRRLHEFFWSPESTRNCCASWRVLFKVCKVMMLSSNCRSSITAAAVG